MIRLDPAGSDSICLIRLDLGVDGHRSICSAVDTPDPENAAGTGMTGLVRWSASDPGRKRRDRDPSVFRPELVWT